MGKRFDEKFPYCIAGILIKYEAKDIKAFIAQELQAQREKTIRIVSEYYEKGLGFNKGSINDSLFQSLKSKLTKQK